MSIIVTISWSLTNRDRPKVPRRFYCCNVRWGIMVVIDQRPIVAVDAIEYQPIAAINATATPPGSGRPSKRQKLEKKGETAALRRSAEPGKAASTCRVAANLHRKESTVNLPPCCVAHWVSLWLLINIAK